MGQRRGQACFVIIADAVDSDSRDRIHAVVSQHSDGLWHELKDVWWVRGYWAEFWRDLLRPIMGGTDSAALVDGGQLRSILPSPTNCAVKKLLP